MESDLDRIIPRRDPDRRTRLLGILNLTPDSFHDGGIDAGPEDSAGRARTMVREGADALDLGAESSRPGATPVPAHEELNRLLPVLERVVSLGVPISVDTVKAVVARRALEAGASLVNDISALSHDPEMAGVVADADVGVVLMHMRGRPRDMQTRTRYSDVVKESLRYLEKRMEAVTRAGVPERNIVIDPGIGFAKTADQSLEILRRLREYGALGRPVLVGASRKSFLARASGADPAARLPGTLATTALAIRAGADILRVHDVAENARAARTAEAVLGAGCAEAKTVEEPC